MFAFAELLDPGVVAVGAFQEHAPLVHVQMARRALVGPHLGRVESKVQVALGAAEILAEIGISAEVIDPRTLVPLDRELILESVRKTGRLVIVEEDNLTGGWAGDIVAMFGVELLLPIRDAVADGFDPVDLSGASLFPDSLRAEAAALAETIIPETDTPGAREAGVAGFIGMRTATTANVRTTEAARTNVAGGMSGSPVYVDGRLFRLGGDDADAKRLAGMRPAR